MRDEKALPLMAEQEKEDKLKTKKIEQEKKEQARKERANEPGESKEPSVDNTSGDFLPGGDTGGDFLA